MWKIGLDPNNARKWQMGFNSAFKELKYSETCAQRNCMVSDFPFDAGSVQYRYCQLKVIEGLNDSVISRLLLKTYFIVITHIPQCMNGLGSVIGMATGCELDGPGIEYWWGRDFPQLSRPALGPT
jgi:hypothetical protein